MQRIRYARSTDGTDIAWAETGTGTPIVKASNWLTHLNHDLESPVWAHWVRFFADRSNFIRYDERGCGLSERNPGDFGFDRWVEDMEAVIDAAVPDQPVVLLGISQGVATAVAYAVRHPEKVRGLVLYGGYARGWNVRGNVAGAKLYDSIVEILTGGWDVANPAFREVFTSRFLPEGTDEQIAWYNDLCVRTMSSETAATLLRARADVDVADLLAKVNVPVLVVHTTGDQVTPLAEGQYLARNIPGAVFHEIASGNHILTEAEPGWKTFIDVTDAFLDEVLGTAKRRIAHLALTSREAEVFGLLCEGRYNKQIAVALGLSERTVRNHLSNIYRKLGVTSRAQAVLMAKGA